MSPPRPVITLSTTTEPDWLTPHLLLRAYALVVPPRLRRSAGTVPVSSSGDEVRAREQAQ